MNRVNKPSMDALCFCFATAFSFMNASGLAIAETMVEKLKRQAEQGETKAQYELGTNYLYGVIRYSDGSGVEKNPKTGEKWLLRAAENGDMFSHYVLGEFYYNCRYDNCSSQGDFQSYYWLDKFVSLATEKERECKKNCNSHSNTIAESLYMLGILSYQECNHPYLLSLPCESKAQPAFPQSHFGAAIYFREAADRGYRPAQYQLATAYEGGYGVPQDYSQAAKWYRKAAEKGDESARYALGNVYIKMSDYVSAHMWFNLSSTAPFGPNLWAIRKRDEVAMGMTPDQILKAQKLATDWLEDYEKRREKL